MPSAMHANGTVGRLHENIAGALAYLTFIPAVIFLIVEPYHKNRFVRYHSIQCLLLWVAMLAAVALLKLIGIAVVLLPVIGPLLMFLLYVLAGLAAFLLWVVLVVKALQGGAFHIPLLGDLAKRYADAGTNPGP
jgi:uncharacterized membrane protein